MSRRGHPLRVVADGEAETYEATIDGAGYTWAVPLGWRLSESGVWRGSGDDVAHIATQPIVVTQTYRDRDSGAQYVEVAWLARGGWRTRRWPAAVVSSAREMVTALSSVGILVGSDNAGDLVTWFRLWRASNDLPEGAVSQRMGWLDAPVCRAFLAGRTLIEAGSADAGVQLMDEADAGLSQLADAVAPSGTWEGWLAAVDAVRDRWHAWAAIYGAVASVLLDIIGCAPFILDFYAQSGKGKSSTLLLAGSVWGDPQEGRGYLRSWAATVAGIEGYAAALGSLPPMLDETNKVPASSRTMVGSTLYTLANGGGKLRGSRTGGTQRASHWRSVSLSTGEQSVTDDRFTPDEGSWARCIPVPGPPMASAEQAEALVRAIGQHHGHLGPRVVRYLVDLSDVQRAALRARYDEIVAHTGQRATTPMGRRRCTYLAALQVAAEVVHVGIGIPWPECEPVVRLSEASESGAREADRAAAALRDLGQSLLRRPGQLWAPGSGDLPPGASAWLGRLDARDGWTWLAVSPDVVRSELLARGYSATMMLDRWAANGWLRGGSGSAVTSPVRMPGSTPRMVVIRRAALEAVGVLSPDADALG